MLLENNNSLKDNSKTIVTNDSLNVLTTLQSIDSLEQVKEIINQQNKILTKMYKDGTLSLENSIYTSSAWDGDNLVGLVRVVGDGVSIVYIQDVLVKSSHKRQGIGTQMVKEVLKAYENVRQVVLITDEKDESNVFYASLGLKKLTDFQGNLYVRFI